jgi:hypothetical protein
METFADNRVRTLSIMCSAQSAKTETMIACLCWLIAEDPGPTMWVTSKEVDAQLKSLSFGFSLDSQRQKSSEDKGDILPSYDT